MARAHRFAAALSDVSDLTALPSLSPLLASLPDDPPPRSNDGEGDDSVKPKPLNVLFATTVPRLLVELRYHVVWGLAIVVEHAQPPATYHARAWLVAPD